MQQSEHIDQCLVVEWYRRQYPKQANLLFAIPNGGDRHIATAVKLKREGVLAGVSDLFLMIPAGGYHGLFLEMKAKGGRVSDAQKAFIQSALDMGYQAQVAFGFSEAQIVIQNYLQGIKK